MNSLLTQFNALLATLPIELQIVVFSALKIGPEDTGDSA